MNITAIRNFNYSNYSIKQSFCSNKNKKQENDIKNLVENKEEAVYEYNPKTGPIAAAVCTIFVLGLFEGGIYGVNRSTRGSSSGNLEKYYPFPIVEKADENKENYAKEPIYDNNGNLSETKYYDLSNNDLVLKQSELYYPNGETKQIRYYSYNEEIAKIENFDKEGNFNSEITFMYDEEINSDIACINFSDGSKAILLDRKDPMFKETPNQILFRGYRYYEGNKIEYCNMHEDFVPIKTSFWAMGMG